MDGIIVETNGMADPAPVRRTIFCSMNDFRRRTKLDAL